MTSVVAAASTVGGALVATLPARPAGAFPNDVDEGCSYTNVDQNFDFDSSVSWPSSIQSAVRSGIVDWNLRPDYTGSPLLVTHEGPSVDQVLVTYGSRPSGVYATTFCSSHQIVISDAYSTMSSAWFRAVARHEFGHWIGLEHTGDEDSMAGDNPATMATCWSSTADAANATMTQDDVGALNFAHTSAARSAIAANWGFENNTTYWAGNTGDLTFFSTGGSTGPGHARYKSGGAVNYMAQRMNYVDAPSKDITIAMSRKKNASSDTGTVTLSLYSRSVTYGSSPSCDYTTGQDQNNRTNVGSFVIRVSTGAVTPTSSWATTTSISWPTLSGGNQDLELRATTNMLDSGGGPTWARFDNVRVQCVSQQAEGDCL